MSLNKNHKQIREKIAKEKSLNVYKTPCVTKVTINCGIGNVLGDKSAMQNIEQELASITGQKPRFTKAKKSISGFKTREGQKVGYSITLRGRRMWDFLEKLVSIVLPRIRDFSGIDGKKIDESGNLTIGIREHAIFPEVEIDDISSTFGIAVTLTIKGSGSAEETEEYLKNLGFVFKKG